MVEGNGLNWGSDLEYCWEGSREIVERIRLIWVVFIIGENSSKRHAWDFGTKRPNLKTSKRSEIWGGCSVMKET